jgi:hypothetical protein
MASHEALALLSSPLSREPPFRKALGDFADLMVELVRVGVTLLGELLVVVTGRAVVLDAASEE